jgi:hypothetical protein
VPTRVPVRKQGSRRGSTHELTYPPISIPVFLVTNTSLTLDEKYALCRSVGEECIQEEELRLLLEKKPVPICYDGFEPSGRMHIAQGVMKCLNVNKLTKAGCHFKFWVADWCGRFPFPRSAFAIAHTRPSEGTSYDQKGLIPLPSTLTVYVIPIPDIHMAERLTLFFPQPGSRL